jgi:hypothetical protein
MQAVTIDRAVRKLREASWLDLLKCAYFLFIASFIVGLAVSAEVRREVVKPATLVILMMLIAAKDLVHAPEAFARFRSARATQQGLHRQLAALLPPGLNGWFRLEREMWRGCLAWVRRKPNPAVRPAGTKLHFLEKGSYSAAAGIVLVGIFGELPVSHLFASLMVADPALEAKVHAMLVLGSIYSLVWVAGDRWHMASGYHVLGSDELDLKVGARAAARIPLSQIVGASRIDEDRAQWCRRKGISLRGTAVISPIDRPNVVLMLAPGARVPLTLCQLERNAPQYLFLYLDRPELLLSRLAMSSGLRRDDL